MYHHLRGKLVELNALDVVLETSGVGWQVQVPLSTSEALRGREGDEVLLLTHLLVREDDLRLFGFATRQERQVFRLLLSVSRMGPSIALQALSSCAAADLVAALSAGDTAPLCRIKGVGKKLAERLILELREKATLLALELSANGSGRPVSSGATSSTDPTVATAVTALSELGYSTRDAERRADEAFRTLSEAANGAPIAVEAIIREALRR